MEFTPETLEKDSFDFDKFNKESKSQINYLTERISKIETRLVETERKLDHFNQASNEMVQQRKLTKKLIKDHQENFFKTSRAKKIPPL